MKIMTKEIHFKRQILLIEWSKTQSIDKKIKNIYIIKAFTQVLIASSMKRNLNIILYNERSLGIELILDNEKDIKQVYIRSDVFNHNENLEYPYSFNPYTGKTLSASDTQGREQSMQRAIMYVFLMCLDDKEVPEKLSNDKLKERVLDILKMHKKAFRQHNDYDELLDLFHEFLLPYSVFETDQKNLRWLADVFIDDLLMKK